jgi:multidrug transporter EmrE-like cation transporter
VNDPLIALLAVFCNASAQVAMKFAGRAGLSGAAVAADTTSRWLAWLSPWLLASVALYGLSFLLTIRVFANNALSVASPLMAGLTFVCIVMASWLVLGEAMDVRKVGGIVLILAGIVVLTYR